MNPAPRRLALPAPAVALAAALLASAAAAAPGHAPDPDLKAIGGFKLTVPLLEKATVVHEKLLAKALESPQAAAATQVIGGGHTLAESAAKLEANPVVAAALKEAGVSARDYLLTIFSSMSAGMMLELKQKGVVIDKTPEGVNPANVALLAKEGAAAFKRLQESSRKLSAATRKPGKQPEREEEPDEPEQ